MKLTENFTLQEFVVSEKAKELGIRNIPDAEVIYCIKCLCQNVLQPLRNEMGSVHVTSGFRCLELNAAVGGVSSSQHIYGKAADIKTKDMNATFHYIKDNLLFDQLIWEYGDEKQPAWIHVSYNEKNRKQVLVKQKGKRYQNFNR